MSRMTEYDIRYQAQVNSLLAAGYWMCYSCRGWMGTDIPKHDHPEDAKLKVCGTCLKEIKEAM